MTPKTAASASGSDAVDRYIAGLSPDVADRVEQVRKIIATAVPDSGEKISYQIPAVTIDGKVVCYYAGWKHHVGMYPIPSLEADPDLDAEIASLRAGKDSVHLRHSAPLPAELIARLVGALREIAEV